MTSRLCKVYKSQRKEMTFLYVDFARDLESVPAELLENFGEPQLVMSLQLQPERRLAVVKGSTVLKQIEQCGYYLQLPPPPEHAVTQWLRGDKVDG
ncbi:MAG: YcgL domain-containing protein [Pseudomonadales bacterium]